MADTVGYVYVKVLSDSRGFKKGVKDAGAVAGKDASVEFGKEFHDGITKDLNKLNLSEQLKPQLKKWGRDYAKQVTEAVKKGQEVRFDLDKIIPPKDVKKIAQRLRIAPEELRKMLEIEIPRAAQKGFATLEKEQAESLSRQQKQRIAYLRWTVSTQQKYDRMARKEATRTKPMHELLDNKAFTKSVKKMAKDFQKIMTPAMRKALTDGQKVDWVIHKDVRKSLRQIAKDSNASFSDVERHFDRMIRKMVKSSKQVTAGGGLFGRLRQQVQQSSTWMDRFDSRITKVRMGLRRAGTGGFFDSLTNILGSLIGLAAKFGKVVFNVVSKVGDGFIKLGGILTRVAGGMGKFGGAIAKVGGAFAKVGKFLKSPWGIAIAAVIAFITVGTLLTKVLGSMVTLVVDLAGMLAMLAAGIGAAVVASAIFVPIIISLAAGLGALVIAGLDAAKAVMSYQKAMAETDPKKRAEALKEYREELAKLGPATRKAVEATNDLVGSFADFKKSMAEKFFSAGVSGLANGLKQAKPLVDALKQGLMGVSGAMGDVVDEFLRLGQSPQFMKDFNRLWQAAEVIVRNVGKALVNFFAGLTSFFAIVSPYAERFSKWILDISEKFRLWAQTDEGRSKMTQFFRDAWNLAKQLWDVLASLTGVVVTFFRAIIDGPEGEASGGFLKSIADWLDTIKTKIEEAEKNGKLKKWMEDAKETGRQLWEALKLIGQILKDLNTEENRAFLRKLITLFKVLMVTAKVVVGAISSGFLGIVGPIKLVWWAVKTLVGWIKSLIGWIGRIHWPKPPAWLGKIVGGGGGGSWAVGGVAMSPTRKLIGEAGPEAVIPLTRPLSQIDPSVRGMAAMIRGYGPSSSKRETAAVAGRQTNNYWTINTPSEDPRVVASQVINRMAAMAG